MKSYLPLIVGMMAVTYLPRLLPLIALSERPLNPLLRRFFLYIPYTALGALIIRGAMEAEPEMAVATLAGIGVAAAFSWIRGGLVTSVAASIIAAFLILYYL
ncbi:MAG: branched-chain amino acid transporter [Peptococcaceae bacterium BICA1-7]|nr:MAG: branched-chain amino acid transporter [Peptococcaceae bacterium BICA1-7]HBV98474.1 AzlD domain-containing protein [Desulfotomaculum sp.]